MFIRRKRIQWLVSSTGYGTAPVRFITRVTGLTEEPICLTVAMVEAYSDISLASGMKDHGSC